MKKKDGVGFIFGVRQWNGQISRPWMMWLIPWMSC